MDREEVHGAWAPEESAWSDWVKSVLFACLPDEVAPEQRAIPAKWREVARSCAGDFAIVVDLPGADGVVLGVALSQVGYRPVPLYNALPHERAFVELEGVMQALVDGVGQLPALPPSAPPAFLVDALRTTMRPALLRVAAYDNRSVVRETDFPSPSRLSNAGIRRALLIRTSWERPAPDLESVLLEWQTRGIELWRVAASETQMPQPFRLEPRPWYARAWGFLISTGPRARWDGTYGRWWAQGG